MLPNKTQVQEKTNYLLKIQLMSGYLLVISKTRILCKLVKLSHKRCVCDINFLPQKVKGPNNVVYPFMSISLSSLTDFFGGSLIALFFGKRFTSGRCNFYLVLEQMMNVVF